MNLASEMLQLTNSNSYKQDAVNEAIKRTKDKIKNCAQRGERSCYIDFGCMPGGYQDFIDKYGKEAHDQYRRYDVETELRNYFSNEGFSFRRVSDLVLGGVRQDPFWKICW